MFRPLVAALALSFAAADPPGLPKPLADKVTAFQKKQSQLGQTVDAWFAKQEAALKSPPAGKGAEFAARREQLQKARAEFKAARRFPADELFLGVQLDYFTGLAAAYGGVSRAFDDALRRAKPDDAAGLAAAKKSIDDQLLGADKLVPGAVWRGSFYFGTGASVKYHLRVDKRAGNTFEGVVVDNPGVANHPEYRVAGTVDGLTVSYRWTRSDQGGIVAAEVAGVLAGDRLVGTNTQTVRAVGRRPARQMSGQVLLTAP